MKIFVILGHGSKSKNSNTLTEKVADEISKTLNVRAVIANLQLSPPFLEDVIEREYKQGARSFIVHPFFLHKGVHVEEDIPNEIEKLKGKYTDADFFLTDVTGSSGYIIKAVIEMLKRFL